ncbi:MAG: signal peptidase I [Bacilli bacterium]|nr:signal peptidase I [Bacilli bacterium]
MNNNLNENSNYFGVRHYNVKVVKEKIKPLKFISSVISYALFIWLLLIGLTLLVYIADIKIRAAKGDNSPPKYNAYVVLTGSMEPEIMTRDVVVTKKREPKEYEVGDIITFLSSDSRLSNIIVTHRIVNKYYDATTGKYSYRTKGDANNTEDMALAEDYNIIGEVIFKIPKLGHIQEILATKGGLIIIILIPCLAILSYDIVKLGKNIRKKMKKKEVTVVRR